MSKKRSSISLSEDDDTRIKVAASEVGLDFSAFVVRAALEWAERIQSTARHRAAFEKYVHTVLTERGELQPAYDEITDSSPEEDEEAARRVRIHSFVAGYR